MQVLLDDGNTPERHALVHAARALGLRVVLLHDAAGWQHGDFEWGLWFGESPTPERYAEVVAQARERNVTLLNDAPQHQTAVEFHRTAPLLLGLTARTEVVSSPAEVDKALEKVPPPVFVRGSLGSHKARGLGACVAHDVAAAHQLALAMFASPEAARGRVLIRELLPLRHTAHHADGFPLPREYRLFVLDADVVAASFAWDFADPFGLPSGRELDELHQLAREVAIRTRVPWLCVDVAQLESGAWRVIETDEPGRAGLGTLSPATFLSVVNAALEARLGC